MGDLVNIISITVSISTLLFVYLQIRVAIQANRATMMIGHIDQLYTDPDIQLALAAVYSKKLRFRFNRETLTASLLYEHDIIECTND